METNPCFHCGKTIVPSELIAFRAHVFCCNGCKTVYEIFTDNGLSRYYDFAATPGASPDVETARFDFLDQQRIVSQLLDFDEGDTQMVTLHIPHIHCSSCIWILENLQPLDPGIKSGRARFHERTVQLVFDAKTTTLKNIVSLLASIGYEPYISLENVGQAPQKTDRSLVYRLGVAFFCFGNIMLLSFPEYFEMGEFWLDQYKPFFRWLIFALALPSFLYSANLYYVAAWRSIKARLLNIEIPIALGIVVMFVRSTVDIFWDRGPGFFDSLTGLVFFMLLGRMFQLKTYRFLSFERDYRSYFPVAVTRLEGLAEVPVALAEVQTGDRLLIRNQEIIPADSILMSSHAAIDYSFVTGESEPIIKKSGDRLFAGGRHTGAPIEIETCATVSQSHLTRLWGNEVFSKSKHSKRQGITDAVSHYFTPALLFLAFAGWVFWAPRDLDTAFNVFTAVLIVACPCALALTAPFTFGNVLRILGRYKFYLKDASVIERLAKADVIVFDKTGTITMGSESTIRYDGMPLSQMENRWVRSVLRASNHPLSRQLYDHLSPSDPIAVAEFEERAGQGVWAVVDGHRIVIGSAALLGFADGALETAVHFSIDGHYKGKFTFGNTYRPQLAAVLERLRKRLLVKLLSGDREGQRQALRPFFADADMHFDQSPEAKLRHIESLQQHGHGVIMVGDGLNDAGALAQSDAGIAVSENVNVFSPACDAILDASAFGRLPAFLQFSRDAMTVIKLSFGLSLLYNVVGLSFALSGHLQPIVAAIIMPLSTVTIVTFVTLASNFCARRRKISGV